LFIKSDSELITGHVDKSYKAQNPELMKYLVAVRRMEKYFLGFGIRSFARALNKEADELTKAVAQKNPLPPDVFFETLKHGSIHSDKAPVKFVLKKHRTGSFSGHASTALTFVSIRS
jgi:hypothetical protein